MYSRLKNLLSHWNISFQYNDNSCQTINCVFYQTYEHTFE